MLPGNLSNLFETGLQHRFDDAYYRTRTPLPERIKVPFLSAGNWGGLGLHLRGNVIAFEQAASPQKWLEMHTDTHFASMYLAEAVALQMRFFDHFLKGEQNGFDKEPPVLLTIRDPRGFRPAQGERVAARAHRMGAYALDASDTSLGEDSAGAAAKTQYDGAGRWRDVPQRAVRAGHRVHRAAGREAVRVVVDDRHGPVPDAARVRPAGKEVTFKGANDPAGAGVAGLAARLAAQARSGALEALPAVPSA